MRPPTRHSGYGRIVPHAIGAYEITAPLGAGGMGEVYRARDTKIERDVTFLQNFADELRRRIPEGK